MEDLSNLTENQLKRATKNFINTIELNDFKKDIKKLNNKFFILYVEAIKEEYRKRIKTSPQIKKYYEKTRK